MDKLTAPADWKDNNHWFEDVSEDVRRAFVKEHCTSVYSWDGQACVVISYPRRDGRVAVYDMDGARIVWAPLKVCRVGGLFESVYRCAEPDDFAWNAISESLLSDEAYDISELLPGRE